MEPAAVQTGIAGVLSRRRWLAGLSATANTRFLWSHAGGTLIGAVSRVVNTRLHHVRRFYYDTAASANPIAMQGLKPLLGGTSHIVFGTDLPYGTSAQMRQALQTVGFSPIELTGIERDNALALLPAYRA